MNQFEKIPAVEQKTVSEKDRREAAIIDANKWISDNIKQIHRAEINENQIEVFSDEAMTEEDIAFMIRTKQILDDGQMKPLRVIILNEENWETFMKKMNRNKEQQEFTGRSEENPVVPDELDQFIVLPSSDVLKKDTAYKHLIESSPLAEFDSEDQIMDLYRSIFLRNILSHELAHLYQFSEEEANDISGSESDEEFDNKYNKNLEKRENLSVTFGLYNLYNEDKRGYEIFVDVCSNIVRDNLGNSYVQTQAQKTLNASERIDQMNEIEFQEAHRQIRIRT
ncbi:MAG: hypothetical protein GF347_00975 [Candidatus Moranbacteria bacterium]|nr:hypothetical protein [Candidatus Moranbacteria bacterium]